MSKFLKLKEWLSLEEAAQYLSISLGETLSKKDLLKFGIDGHLELSIYFSEITPLMLGFFADNQYMESKSNSSLCSLEYQGKDATFENDNESDLIGDEKQRKMGPLEPLNDEISFVPVEGNVCVNGIGCWDFAMIGTGKNFVIDEYNKYEGVVKIANEDLKDEQLDFFVHSPENESPVYAKVLELCEPFPWEAERERPLAASASALPRGSSIIVRVDAIKDFEISLASEPDAKLNAVLSEGKEQTYLAVIAALLEKMLSNSKTPITQDSIACDIEAEYGGANNGMSHSQLTKLFPKAKKALSEKEKK